MIKIRYSSGYRKGRIALKETCPDLGDTINRCINLFKKNPEDSRLFTHPLHKRLKGQWAFSITDDIRIVYEWIGKRTVRFLAIGGHDSVYRRN